MSIGKNMLMAAAGSGEAVLGITLKQTVSTDENGEKLLHYPQKKDEIQAVNSGEAVPVATRGLFMVDARGVNETPSALSVGTKVSCHGNGKFGPHDSANDVAVGTILGRGSRQHWGHPNATGSDSANYYLIQLNPAV